MRVGLISDTHGAVDARVHPLLAGVDEIVHAGDVCGADVLLELEAIAPVHACRGNCDFGDTGHLPMVVVREYPAMGGLRVMATHILGRGRSHAPSRDVLEVVAEQRADVVVFGHTHRPDMWRQDGVLYVNPGSVTEPRGNTLGLGRMRWEDGALEVEVIGLDGVNLHRSTDCPTREP